MTIDPEQPTEPKTLLFGNEIRDSNLLVSLEDITILRDREAWPEIYFVVVGYDTNGRIQDLAWPREARSVNLPLPKGALAGKVFYLWISPITSVRRGRKHVFPGGLPLFYGDPGKLTSLYFAVMESDERGGDVGKALQSYLEANQEANYKSFLSLATGITDTTQIEVVKQAFQFLIGAVQTFFINSRDDIRYTNVFTFREQEGYLAGTHSDWGNQRVSLTLEVEAPI